MGYDAYGRWQPDVTGPTMGPNAVIDPMTGQPTMAGLAFQQQQMQLEQQKMQMEMQRAAAMKAQGLNPDGSPISPEWQSLLDANGNLKDQYKINVQQLDPTKWEGYSKYKQEALRTGPSTWAQLQLQQQAQQAAQQRAQAAQQAMTGTNQAMAQLAMRGGLGAGARTSLARQQARDLMMARQGVSNNANINRLATLSTDEQNRIQQLGNLASSEQNIGQYNTTLGAKQQEANLNNLLREIEGKRSFDQETYKERMRAWAANKQAEATANSGGGGK